MSHTISKHTYSMILVAVRNQVPVRGPQHVVRDLAQQPEGDHLSVPRLGGGRAYSWRVARGGEGGRGGQASRPLLHRSLRSSHSDVREVGTGRTRKGGKQERVVPERYTMWKTRIMLMLLQLAVLVRLRKVERFTWMVQRLLMYMRDVSIQYFLPCRCGS